MQVTKKYLPVRYALYSPIRVIGDRIERPTRLDVLRDIAENSHGLYDAKSVKSAKREIMKEFS